MISSFSLQVSHIIRLVHTSPSINMSLRGEVNYRDHLSTQQRLFLDLTVHVTDLRSFVIFHNRVSLCVWKLACQKVRMWLCHHLQVTPPHHLNSSSSPPLIPPPPPDHHLHSSSSSSPACLHSDGFSNTAVPLCMIVICIVAFRRAFTVHKKAQNFYGLANSSM